MNRSIRSVCLALGTLVVGAAPAIACVNVGVYQDQPAKTLPALQKKAGKNVKTVSTYVTAVTGSIPSSSRSRHARRQARPQLDARQGQDSAKAPGYRLSAIATGKFDGGLRALAPQLGRCRMARSCAPCPSRTRPGTRGRAASTAIARPSTSRPGSTSAGADQDRRPRRCSCSGAPYARSVPDDPQNAIERVLPGRQAGRPGGRDAYNFGTAQGLTWSAPAELFATAYATSRARAEAVLDRRDRLDRPWRRRARLDRRARRAGHDDAEAEGRRLVRRPRQHGDFRLRASLPPPPHSRRS